MNSLTRSVQEESFTKNGGGFRGSIAATNTYTAAFTLLIVSVVSCNF